MDGERRLPRRTGISYIASFFNKKKIIDAFEALPSGKQDSSVEYEPRVFSYQELEKATRNFKQIIGAGGYGRVFLGQLPDRRMVAVKELIDNNLKQLQQFNNEVAILSHLRHRNLVKLYGWTNPLNQKMLLVYELVPNGTLFDHLHGQVQPLPWPVRMRVAFETSQALYYLHSAKPPIIHRDVKPENILLDHDYSAKVADFGLCRQLPLGMKNISTQTPGTMGYQDPEYQRTITLTEKSDVYSFGVLLLELISGQKAVDSNRDLDNIYLDSMALNMIKDKESEMLVDPELGYQSNADVRMKINCVIELAHCCLKPKGDMRPSMGEVLKMLRGLQDEIQDAEGPKCIVEQTADQQASNDHQEEADEQEETNPFHHPEEADEQEETNPFHSSRRLGFTTIFTYDELKKAANYFRPSQSRRLGLDTIFTYDELKKAANNFRPSIFTYDELKKAANNFRHSQMIEVSPNAISYLGKLDGLMVTIKLLSGDGRGVIGQFLNEVTVHSLFRHKNLLTLYGCTNSDATNLLTVYEIVSNGTLADHLHGRRHDLSWAVRIRIAIETAEALAYLQSLKTSVVHLGLNSHNILLDKAFNVKLTGLDECYSLSTTFDYTPECDDNINISYPGNNINIGYMDSEYMFGSVTKKTVVYSFGVVLLELISGEKAWDHNRVDKHLVSMALNRIGNNQRLYQFVDRKLFDQPMDKDMGKEIWRMIKIVANLACKCVQNNRNMRPSIGEVLTSLKEIRSGLNKQL